MSGKATVAPAASVSTVTVAKHILVIRDQNVLLDTDLAALYGVPTKVLVQAVKRNMDRFPDDFMFQLDDQQWESLRSQSLRSQSVTSNTGRGGRRYAPYAFTEQGVAMVSLMSVQHDTFAHNTRVQLKQVFEAIRELMTPPDIPPKRSIGFVTAEEKPTRPKAVRKR